MESMQTQPCSQGRRIIEAMQFPPLNWSLPRLGREVERRVLKNGTVAFLQPDHSLPLVRLHLRVRGGSLHEDRARHRLASIAASAWHLGGTELHSPQEFTDLLELNGIELQVVARLESTALQLSCLSDRLPRALELLGELLAKPRFDEEKLAFVKEKHHEALRRRNDQIEDIAFREFENSLFGDDPQGFDDSWDDISALDLTQVRAWHAAAWNPQRSLLAVSGDFDPEELERQLEKYWAQWIPNDAVLPPIPAQVEQAHKGVFVVEREVTQSSLCLGHLGVSRNEEHLEDVELANYILGGGSFSSRLMDKVRTRDGLAYSIGSHVDLSSLRRGRAIVYGQVKAEETGRVLDCVREEMELLQRELVSEEEFSQARQALENGIKMAFYHSGAASRVFLQLEVLSRPADFYEGYLKRLSQTTRQSVLEAAQRLYRPDDILAVVVGSGELLAPKWPESANLPRLQIRSFS